MLNNLRVKTYKIQIEGQENEAKGKKGEVYTLSHADLCLKFIEEKV